jgi:hypothetical protein
MAHLIDKVLANPTMIGLLASLFAISIWLFWRRVKRENSSDYRKPKSPISRWGQ